jgi:glycerophosphoryl diester phosphodiesterase
MKRSVLAILICLGMGSCDPRLPAGFVDPDVFEFIDEPTARLSDSGKSFMNGVYEVVQGSSELGSPVVGRWIGDRWCLFSQHDVVFSVCAGGSSGDSIKLLGYVRYVRSGSGIRARFIISNNNGATELISGVPPPSLRIQGETEDHKKIELRRIRNVNSSRFEILAHRGGGRNSDRLGISENSIPMIRYAAVLGATGVELDVKRTRDDKLIIFHDDSFSPRTVQGAYLLGKVENYDLEQITSLGKLIYGEEIPTLSQALRAVIDDTELSLVWLDIKDPKAVGQVVQIQKDMMAYAATRHRESVSILLGIPSQEVLNAYIPFKNSIFADAAVELGADIALSLPGCRVWGPSWTQDITPGDLAKMQPKNIRVFIWTVDLREGIVDFLNRGVDGIVSNYPTLVAGIHGSRDSTLTMSP